MIHTYILLNSDSLGLIFVSKIFDGTSFGSDSTSPHLQYWIRFTGMVTSWLHNAMVKEIGESTYTLCKEQEERMIIMVCVINHPFLFFSYEFVQHCVPSRIDMCS